MFASQDKSRLDDRQANAHSYICFEADPYLEWYANWVIVRYTIKQDGKDQRRHISVPPSSIYSFNWDWKQNKH